jgi:hypothetical protein
MKALVWNADGSQGPGSMAEVELPVLDVRDRGLLLADLEVVDVRPDALFDRPGLCFDHAFGGGPLASPEADRQARAFGVVNVAYHLHRGMEHLATLLGQQLPQLRVKIGIHAEEKPSWGGAHYRLPAEQYWEVSEPEPPAPAGEIHFGPGGRFLPYGAARYFHMPSHSAAIAYHELGHHLCRHTADFRLNNERPAGAQHNRKIPLDEGTSDYFAAVLLNTPDIFGWHRADYPPEVQERRRVDGEWTMASFWGQQSPVRVWGEGTDAHVDGTIWSATLWATRQALQERGICGEVFDRLVAQALLEAGPADSELPRLEAVQRRRSFARILQAILDIAQASQPECAETILRTFAERGIVLEGSNEELRDRSRSTRLEAHS